LLRCGWGRAPLSSMGPLYSNTSRVQRPCCRSVSLTRKRPQCPDCREALPVTVRRRNVAVSRQCETRDRAGGDEDHQPASSGAQAKRMVPPHWQFNCDAPPVTIGFNVIQISSKGAFMSSTEQESCPGCQGSGKCFKCGGSGHVVQTSISAIPVLSGQVRGESAARRTCQRCMGSGTCTVCKGTGKASAAST
jgi:hypothetical protein